MTRNQEMSPSESARLRGALSAGGHYLEYGAGSSTSMAAQIPAVSSITSVESDPEFIARLQALEGISQAISAERLRFLAVDVGPVGRWGTPLDSRASHLWPNYALSPYRHPYRPDVILIDGRFRVACGLVAALQAPQALVLVHDYANRPNYRLLEQFLEPVEVTDTLAELRRRPAMDEERARLLLRDFLYCPSDLLNPGRVHFSYRASNLALKAARWLRPSRP